MVNIWADKMKMVRTQSAFVTTTQEVRVRETDRQYHEEKTGMMTELLLEGWNNCVPQLREV